VRVIVEKLAASIPDVPITALAAVTASESALDTNNLANKKRAAATVALDFAVLVIEALQNNKSFSIAVYTSFKVFLTGL
jgi:hypothetical protein